MNFSKIKKQPLTKKTPLCSKRGITYKNLDRRFPNGRIKLKQTLKVLI
jgi:hypothetical protein